MHTRDLEEAIDSVGRIYCEHRLRLHPTASAVDTELNIHGPIAHPVVRLRYGAPVSVEAGDLPGLILIMRCTGGKGTVSQGSKFAEWQWGRTLAVSAGAPTGFKFGREFSQTTLRVDPEHLNMMCSRALGRPLERPMRFDLVPFSNSMEATWNGALSFLDADWGAQDHPEAVNRSIAEFLLNLLLHGHPHTYTEAMARLESQPQARVVRRARDLVEADKPAILHVSELASALEVSVRTLQASFRAELKTTPLAYLRKARLQRAREALLCGDASTTVTEAALALGFLHLGRFSMHYKSAFGESPSITLAKALQRR